MLWHKDPKSTMRTPRSIKESKKLMPLEKDFGEKRGGNLFQISQTGFKLGGVFILMLTYILDHRGEGERAG